MGGVGGSLDQNIFGALMYLGLVFTSSVIIMLNSSQQLHHAFLASGAPNAFFATEIPTPSKGEHIHLTFFAGVVLCTLWVPRIYT